MGNINNTDKTEDIFKDLMKIEEQTSIVTKRPEEKRAGLEEKIRLKKIEIEEKIKKETEDEIQRLREASHTETMAQIAGISTESQRKFSEMEVSFDKHHEEWESEIFHKIIGK